MSFLTKAELEYRLDVVEGRFRKQVAVSEQPTKGVTLEDIFRGVSALQKSLMPLVQAVQAIPPNSPLGRMVTSMKQLKACQSPPVRLRSSVGLHSHDRTGTRRH